MSKDDARIIKLQRVHPEGVTYDIKFPEGTLFDSNAWGRELQNFGSPLSFGGISSIDGRRPSSGERGYSGDGRAGLVDRVYNFNRAEEKPSGRDMFELVLDLGAKARLGSFGGIDVEVNLGADLFSQLPQLSISTKFFGISSSGVTTFNAPIPITKNFTVDFQIDSNWNAYIGATITNVWAIGIRINTEVMVERYQNEMFKLYKTEFGRWYDRGIDNIYNVPSVHMSQML